jgi:hypothetical protein
VNNQQLPLWHSSKKVRAAKIISIQDNGVSVSLEFSNPQTTVVQSMEWYRWQKPEVGGYYVVGEDGYTHFIAGLIFEKIYKPGNEISIMNSLTGVVCEIEFRATEGEMPFSGIPTLTKIHEVAIPLLLISRKDDSRDNAFWINMAQIGKLRPTM